MTSVLTDLAGLAAMTGGVLALVRVTHLRRAMAAPRSAHRTAQGPRCAERGTRDPPKAARDRALRAAAPRSIPMTGEHRRRPHHVTFGNDRFGVLAERFARAFGTPRFIIGQTVVVALWIGANAVAFSLHWDPYPFILLNLAFSTQAAYAAPLILLAQTRQAERDRVRDTAVQEHRDAQVRHQEDVETSCAGCSTAIASRRKPIRRCSPDRARSSMRSRGRCDSCKRRGTAGTEAAAVATEPPANDRKPPFPRSSPSCARAAVDICRDGATMERPMADSDAKVCLTFDFDAISVWPGLLGMTSPSAVSRGEFSGCVAVPRVLDVLKREGVSATFFVPGITVEAWAAAVPPDSR
jgi:Protein of unknown function (DUF1003)